MEKPIYFLKLEISGGNYDARVNDCPIVSEREGSPVSATIPINEWIEGGGNLLTVRLTPIQGEEIAKMKPQVSATLSAMPFASLSAGGSEIPLRSFTFGRAAAEKGAETPADVPSLPFRADTLEGGILLTAAFDAERSIPPLPWSAGKAEPITEDVTKALTDHLKTLWQILNTKDLPALRTWFVHRNRDVAARRYTDLADVEKSTEASFAAAFKDAEMPLHPFWERDLVTVAYGYGRLLRVEIGPLGKSPVFFAEKDFSVINYIEIGFCRIPEVGFAAIR